MPQDFPKDFELVRLDLINAAGERASLRFVFLEMSWFECIWNNNITVKLLINDATNLLMNFPVFGYETLDIAFRTPDKGLIEKTLRLHRITNRELVKERELAYVLHFVTHEAITNLKLKVSKAYKGKLISDIVDDIHNKWLLGGPIEIEPTTYQHHIIIPNLFPVHAINWLCTRANSANYKGANYLYYEDSTKFRFVTIESRLAQEPSISYLFQTANVRKDDDTSHKSRDFETDIIAAEAYEFDNVSDVLDNMQTGMYGNELYVHSQNRKLWEYYNFDYPTSFDQYKHLYPGNLLESRVKGDTNSAMSKSKLHSDGNQTDYPFKPQAWIPPRISQLQQLQNIVTRITVPGDSDRTVGQVVKFNLPSPEPPIDNKQIDDKYYKGKYLIASLHHIIDPNRFLTTMELVKDSVQEPYI